MEVMLLRKAANLSANKHLDGLILIDEHSPVHRLLVKASPGRKLHVHVNDLYAKRAASRVMHFY